MTDSPQQNRPATEADPLALLIRAAGRRPAPQLDDFDVVRAAAHDAWQASLKSRRTMRRWKLSAAAAVIVSIGIGAIFTQTLTEHPGYLASTQSIQGTVSRRPSGSTVWEPLSSEAIEIFAGDRIRTNNAARVAFELTNGISLRVQSDTEFEFVSLDAVSLSQGTVYVDSGDGARPQAIHIQTAHGIITDIGTQFEVRSTDSTLRVRVRSGLVTLTESDLTENISGGASEEIEVTPAGVSRREFPADHIDWQWAQRLAAIPAADTASIRDYLRWISKETGLELAFDSINTEMEASLQSLNRTPEVTMPMDVLDLLVMTTTFEYDSQNVANGRLYIRRK
jgi:hypothetical protein